MLWQRCDNVIRRRDQNTTKTQRCYNVVCQLGKLLPMKSLSTKERDMAAVSLFKLMLSENSTRFGFNPSTSTPCLGSQRKPNLLIISIFERLHLLTAVDILNAWSRSIPQSRILSTLLELPLALEGFLFIEVLTSCLLLASGFCHCSNVSLFIFVLKILPLFPTKRWVNFVIPQIFLLNRKTILMYFQGHKIGKFPCQNCSCRCSISYFSLVVVLKE